MRSLFALLVVCVCLSGCGGSGSSTLAPTIARGSIESYTLEGTLTTSQMAAAQYAAFLTPAGGAPQCNVAVYQVKYTTVGVHGEAAIASAGVFIPQSGCAGPYPLLGFANGTNSVKSPPLNSTLNQPSSDVDPTDTALAYGSHGYVTAATDYLGLGLSTYPYHPYLQAQTEASSVIDSMRAARKLAAIVGVALSGQVFVVGTSQGGHVAMATQRQIEAQDAAEFDLAGDAPISGPFEELKSVNYVIQDQNPQGPGLLVYLLTGFQKTYGNLYGSAGAATVFKAPYASTADALLPLPTASQAPELATDLPATVPELLQPAFLTSLADASSSIDSDLALNSLLSGWKPAAPVYLCGAHTDPLVTFENSTDAQAYFKGLGATSTITDVTSDVPPSLTGNGIHSGANLICMGLSRANFIDKLRTAYAARKTTSSRGRT